MRQHRTVRIPAVSGGGQSCANSTFSFWAAVLGGNRVFAPVIEEQVGLIDASFVPGNHPAS
jgi:hypothetical protein